MVFRPVVTVGVVVAAASLVDAAADTGVASSIVAVDVRAAEACSAVAMAAAAPNSAVSRPANQLALLSPLAARPLRAAVPAARP
jgi:hypothetical protein